MTPTTGPTALNTRSSFSRFLPLSNSYSTISASNGKTRLLPGSNGARQGLRSQGNSRSDKAGTERVGGGSLVVRRAVVLGGSGRLVARLGMIRRWLAVGRRRFGKATEWALVGEGRELAVAAQ
ncbi:unnamed protein product [Sphenostylis stenocarpa]|uniref:Uncharacterized protein n=1 Tax=Sphenostylis stenocarpa TaxID=92480 RepID=A0AA86S9S1_9FABA|nr:unnamed protein product [Sphenostylis stenocarpa]